MDFQRPYKPIPPSSELYGGEKEQMLNLNRRLETYLNRVKLLDDENAKLAKEIQTLRRKHHGDQERRQFLDEQLLGAREEVELVWREKVFAEVDVARLSEELQTLDLQLQRETRAQVEASAKAEQSRRELEEERQAQVWLKEKVGELENEMKWLVQTHREEVSNMEATVVQTTVVQAARPVFQHGPSLLDLGQEYKERAERAWRDAAEAYQSQLTRLEESVSETRQRLVQVNREKSESVMKLQNLEREMMGLQDLREHLESTADRQRESHCHDVQRLQEHLEALEREKQALTQRMEQLLQENRGLVQMKLSLSMEVATYRTLLDSESHKRDGVLQKQPRNIYSKDAAFSPWGARDNYQLSPSLKTISSPLVRSIPMTGKTKSPAITSTPVRYQQYVPRRDKLGISKDKVEDKEDCQKPEVTPYPKVLKDGAVENFRPQEVNEKVTYAEPLSPPDEQEKVLYLENNNWDEDVDQPSEQKQSPFIQSEFIQIEKEEVEKQKAPIDAWIEEQIVSQTEQPSVASSCYQVAPNLEEPFTDEATPELIEEAFTEELSSVAVNSQQEKPLAIDHMEKPQELIDAWVEKSIQDTKVESSDSEKEAFVEPNFDSKSSSPASECDLEEPLQKQVSQLTFESVEASMDDNSPPKEKLYPDGEEMDTWDEGVPKAGDLELPKEILKQHAESEEDSSAREIQQQNQEVREGEEQRPPLNPVEQKESLEEEIPDKSADDDEQDDSQNVSVSWRTEVEGDSYAQDNTLADTRPLIRYKSDETDANTQASHFDDDFSDAEQEKKVGEMESGAEWNEEQARRFGTMEDLCEEAEGQVLDEEYDHQYLRNYGKDEEESDADEDADDTQHEVIRTVKDEEIDTDKLVEQELENLTTECFTTHFAQLQTSTAVTLPDGARADQPIAWNEALEGMPETIDKEDFNQSEARDEPKNDELFETPQQQTDKEVQEVQELVDLEMKDSPDTSVTHCDITMDIFDDGSKLVSTSTSQELSFDQKEPKNVGELVKEGALSFVHGMLTAQGVKFSDGKDSNKPSNTLQEVADPEIGVGIKHTTPEEMFKPEEAYAGFPEVPPTTEWEVLEHPSEINDGFEGDFPKHFSSDDKIERDSFSPTEEPLNMSPDSVREEDDLLIVKDQLKTNGKTNLDELISNNANNDFWVSPLETGATYQPVDNNKHAEWKIGFANVDGSKSEELAEKPEKPHKKKEVSQIFIKGVVKGELVHSEESDSDSEVMSSGEE
ncbi:unnamed protein product [Knipowitschia caucasica]